MITLATLIPIAAKGALVLLAATIVALVLTRRSAAIRHMTWTGGLFAVLALPFLSLAMPEVRIPSGLPFTELLRPEIPHQRFAPVRDDDITPAPASTPVIAALPSTTPPPAEATPVVAPGIAPAAWGSNSADPVPSL